MTPDYREALESLHRATVRCSREFSRDRYLAWLYGIVVGWEDDEENGLMAEFQRDFGWTDQDVATLRRLHAALWGKKLEKELPFRGTSQMCCHATCRMATGRVNDAYCAVCRGKLKVAEKKRARNQ